MSLPSDLVKEFVKITNDKKAPVETTTCYGVAHFTDGGEYVLLDGADDMTPATFTVSAHEGDRVLVMLKNHQALVIANITNPVLTVGVLKANVGIIVRGYLTTNEERTEYNDQTKTGLTFSEGGIGANGGTGKFWYITNDGHMYASDAELEGKVIAKSGYLGSVANGFHIDEYGIYSGTKEGGSNGYITLSNGDFARTINEKSYSDLRFAIGSNFGVTKDGSIHAANVDLTGNLTAESGYLGTKENGFTIDEYGIYSGAKSENKGGYITLSNVDFTRSLNDVVRNQLRFAIGSNFGVSSTGILYASSADISGKIIAGSGKIGEFDIGTGIYSGNKVTFLHQNPGVYIGIDGIALGSGSPFRVTSEGYLYASNADVKGNITATTLKIGYNDVNLYAEENGLLVRDGEREIARFGIDGQTFKNELSQNIFKIGYLPESVASTQLTYIARYDGSTDGFTMTLPWIIYDTSRTSSTGLHFECYEADRHTTILIPYTQYEYTAQDNVITFSATTCALFNQKDVKYVRCSYTPYGSFPYYTFGDDMDGGDIGLYSVREGVACTASSLAAHSEGEACIASGEDSHAEGLQSIASGSYSHAEGYYSLASGVGAHAEGYGTRASGQGAHAEGTGTASYAFSHAEGEDTIASARASHAGGQCTEAASEGQTVIGRYNAVDSSGKYAFIIGTGTSENYRRSYFKVDWDGNLDCINVGVTKSASASCSIETAGIDTYTTGPSVYLDAGVWVVVGQWVFNTGDSTGSRNLGVMLSSSYGSSSSGGYKLVRTHAASQAWASMEITEILTLSSGTTVYLKAASSMTYSTATTCYIKAVRIK